MAIFGLSFNSLAPIFLIILAGFACKLLGWVTEAEQPRMNKIGFKIFMPVMLFNNIYKSELSLNEDGSLLLFGALALTVVFLLSIAFCLCFIKEKKKRGAMIQCMIRSNSAIIGLPMVSYLDSSALGVASLLSTVIIPLFNLYSVIALEVFSGQRIRLKQVLINIIKNPLIIASILSVTCLLTGLKLPGFLEKGIDSFGAIASPYMLFMLGVFFTPKFRFDRHLAIALIGRLVAVPGVVLAAAAMLGFKNGGFVSLLAIFAGPPAVASFTMAQQLGGDAELAGNSVVMGSAFSFVTIFIWISLFKGLGII